MKDIGSAWDVLGLAATNDVRSIRRAYSARLKAIDVDADPGAFIALRDALDQALAQAGAMQSVADAMAASGGDAPSAKPVPAQRLDDDPIIPGQTPGRTRPEIQFTDGDIDPANQARLNELLFGDRDPDLARDQILKITQTILAQAARARIDKVAHIEAWLAATIANASPRSDVMIDPVVEHFRWTDHVVSWRRSPAVVAILSRQSDLRFLAEVSEPGHRLHAAYLALKAPPSSTVFVDANLRAKIQSLLSIARRDHPNILSDLNAKAVALWSSQSIRQHALSRAMSGGAYWARIGRSYALTFGVGLIVVAGLGWLGREDVRALRSIVTLTAPGGQPPGADDVCQWRAGAGGAQSLSCRRADGQMVPAIAPPGFGPRTLDRANAGDTAAMVAMGRFYATGPAVAHNGERAKAWFRRAADLGDPAAMLDLGLLNGTGSGVTGDGTNLAEAARWYQAAAERGAPQAKYMLGDLYQRGVAVPKDEARAADLFRDAAAHGWIPAKSALGVMYEKGLGVPASQATAVRLYTQAAASNDAAGEYYLAGAYLRGAGVRRSSTEAARLYQLAADKGVAQAMVDLAVLYHKGDGVPASDTHAIGLFQTAAGKGQSTAMYDLGIAYRTGLGVKKNDAEAAKWFRAAADAGAPAAVHQLKAMGADRLGPTARP